MNIFTKFYKKSLDERKKTLLSLPTLTSADCTLLENNQNLPLNTADNMIENCIHLYNIPLGIAPNFVIDNQTYTAPMATEEPSVIAAASFAAQIISKSGGFTTEQQTRAMIGEIALYQLNDYELAKQTILSQRNHLLAIANQAYPSIVKRGGGAIDLTVAIKTSSDNSAQFCVVYLTVDTQEAMGANMLNTMLEALVPHLEQMTGAKALMAILSNYASQAIVCMSCTIPVAVLAKSTTQCSGETLRDRIIAAYQFASADVYRATTHNKGIMNGISAVALATGNDTRAIEAGAHAYASHSGSYQPLTTWKKTATGDLKGTIQLPLAVGTVGGSIAIHPVAQLAQHIAPIHSAAQLSQLMAAVGLAQNFAALRALVTEGIQKGHMSLQIKSLALSVGATLEELPFLMTALANTKQLNQESVRLTLEKLRKKDC